MTIPAKAILYGILIAAIVLRLIGLNQSFWLDEAAQVIESARPLSQQLQIVADFHPPGFHLLLHFWMMFGTSEPWIRLLSVLFGVGSIYLTYLLGKKLGSEKTGLLAALFLTLSPYHLWYSQEARPYMMLVFFGCLSTYLFITKRWRWYTVSLIGTWFSTYFSPFIFLGHLVCVLWLQRTSLRAFLLSHLIAAGVFLLWVPSFLQQLAIGTNGMFSGWTSVVSLAPIKASLLTFAKFIFGRGSIDNNVLYGLVILPVFLLFLYSCWQSIKSQAGKVLLVSFWVPFVASVIVTFIVPILAPQRLTFMLPIFALLLAQGVLSIRKRYQWIGIAAVVLTSVLGIGQYYTDPSVQREQWREAVQFVEQHPSNQHLAVFAFPDPFAPYLWYRRTDQEALGIAPSFQVTDADLVSLHDRIEQKTVIYVFHYLMGLTDPQAKTQHFLETSGFQKGDQKNFEGVGFVDVYQRI